MSTTYRPGTLADSRPAIKVLVQSLADLNRRNHPEDVGAHPEFLTLAFERYQPLFDHLARTAEHFCVAEQDGQIIGYARSILHDGVRNLTDFFVLPNSQAAGVGRELLAQAFPADQVRRKTILATRDLSAQALYLRSGVYPRFSFTTFSRRPEQVMVATDLTIQPVSATRESLAAMRAIDTALLDFTRDADHEFLLHDRQGYLYCRSNDVVGYGYAGNDCGPFALLDASDFPAVLAHAENDAARRGADEFGVLVPLINRAAVDYLLARKCRLHDDYLLFMSDAPFGRFENYIQCSPPMFY